MSDEHPPPERPGARLRDRFSEVPPAIEKFRKAGEAQSKFSGAGHAVAAIRKAAQQAEPNAKRATLSQDVRRMVKNMPETRAARATKQTAELLAHLVRAADDAEERERTMLKWTRAGVVFAAIAAAGALTTIVLMIALD